MSTGTNTPNLGLHNWVGTDKVLRAELDDNFTWIDTWAGTVNAKSISYATDTGAVNALAVTLTPAPTAYADGMPVCVKVSNTTTGAATLNVNNLGAVALKNGDGSAVGAGDLVAGVPVTFRYVSGSPAAFIASGSGGLSGTGNAIAADVLAPYTFTSATGKKQTGTIPTVAGGNTITPGPNQQTAVTANSYVQNAIVVAGVSFDASKLLTGTTVAGTAGTMPNLGSLTFNPSTSTQTAGPGYTSGVTVNPVPGTATAAQILSGYTASSANGINISGTATPRQYASGSGTTSVQGVLTVTGLSFQPTMILVENSNGTYGSRSFYEASSTLNQYNAGYQTNAGVGGSNVAWTVNASGFTCSIGLSGDSSSPCNWWAFG